MNPAFEELGPSSPAPVFVLQADQDAARVRSCRTRDRLRIERDLTPIAFLARAAISRSVL